MDTNDQRDRDDLIFVMNSIKDAHTVLHQLLDRTHELCTRTNAAGLRAEESGAAPVADLQFLLIDLECFHEGCQRLLPTCH